jgi:hypothetical protein
MEVINLSKLKNFVFASSQLKQNVCLLAFISRTRGSCRIIKRYIEARHLLELKCTCLRMDI